jgi:HEAT repeat protein
VYNAGSFFLRYNKNMNWLTGGRFAQGEAKRLISHLSDSTKRERAAQDLIKLGVDAVPTLIEALQARDPNLPPLIRQVIAQMGPVAIPALTQTLRTAHPIIRTQVCEILGQIKDRAAIPPLMEAAQSEFFSVREKSAYALGNIKDPQSIQILITLLDDRETEVRVAACLALGQFRDPNIFNKLGDVLLDDREIEVRQAAARTLGETKNPVVLPYLMEALHDSFWWYGREQTTHVLLDAIEGFGTFAVEPLIEELYNTEAAVRRYAADILGNLHDERAIEPLSMALYDLHHEVGTVAAEALAKFGGASLEVLKETARHPEEGIRKNVALALGNIKDARVAPILLEMLRDPDRTVQKQVVLSLGQLRDPNTMPALQELAVSRTDRELAALARQAIDAIH